MKSLSSLLFKDIVIEWRNKESISSMFMFGLLSLVIFNYAFDPSGAERGALTPGILWVSFMFAGIIGLNRSLTMETDNECLQGLLLAPLSRGEHTVHFRGGITSFGFQVEATYQLTVSGH